MITIAKSPTLSAAAVLELLKPVTWFPPMWAFACGTVSAGAPMAGAWHRIAIGIVLVGPLVCAASQAINDWHDRHVDAINEPQRPIPSGRIPGQWGLLIAILWSALSLAVASLLGSTVLVATALALTMGWAYSAPPLRLKRNGWFGNAACGLCYEGLAWTTGAALMLDAPPSALILTLALLYSVAAHGIMTLNDFKSIEGDRLMGVHTLPVQLGPALAARVACAVMIAPQVVVGLLLAVNAHTSFAVAIGALCLAQMALMRHLLTDPRKLAPWYNATGIGLLVIGMMVAAVAVR